MQRVYTVSKQNQISVIFRISGGRMLKAMENGLMAFVLHWRKMVERVSRGRGGGGKAWWELMRQQVMNAWDCNWKLSKINKPLNLFMSTSAVHANVNVLSGPLNGLLIHFCISYASLSWQHLTTCNRPRDKSALYSVPNIAQKLNQGRILCCNGEKNAKWIVNLELIW